jgi:hypothetical protein
MLTLQGTGARRAPKIEVLNVAEGCTLKHYFDHSVQERDQNFNQIPDANSTGSRQKIRQILERIKNCFNSHSVKEEGEQCLTKLFYAKQDLMRATDDASKEAIYTNATANFEALKKMAGSGRERQFEWTYSASLKLVTMRIYPDDAFANGQNLATAVFEFSFEPIPTLR